MTDQLREGGVASYLGVGREGVSLGDKGEILAFAGSGAWVKWKTGSRQGDIVAVDRYDLAPAPRIGREAVQHDDLEDSLDVGPITTTSMRDVCDAEGTTSVLNMLASSGNLPGFAEIADEALSFVSHRVREEPAIRNVTAQLDGEDAEELIQLASFAILRDAFGSRDG